MSFKLTRQLDAVLFKTQVTEPLQLTVKAMGDSSGELVKGVLTVGSIIWRRKAESRSPVWPTHL